MSTMESPEQYVNSFQSLQLRYQNVIDIVLIEAPSKRFKRLLNTPLNCFISYRGVCTTQPKYKIDFFWKLGSK